MSVVILFILLYYTNQLANLDIPDEEITIQISQLMRTKLAEIPASFFGFQLKLQANDQLISKYPTIKQQIDPNLDVICQDKDLIILGKRKRQANTFNATIREALEEEVTPDS